MDAMNVLVAGATGLLGAVLVPELRRLGHRVTAHGHHSAADVQADLGDAAQTAALLERLQPDVIVNLVALTDVDRCEAEPRQAYSLNVGSVERIADWVSRSRPRCHLVHISTDQLYDGPGPHDEDALCIRNAYAMSKRTAELAAATVDATVLRTNFFGRSPCIGRASFSDWLFGALREGRPIRVFDDVLFNPLAIDTLAQCIALTAAVQPRGVFNLGSRGGDGGGMSKADFAFAFADAAGLPTVSMTRASVADHGALKARRPTDMRMDCRRIESALGLTLPELNAEIQRTGSAYRAPA